MIGNSTARLTLLRDYDLIAGRPWVLLLSWIASAPYLFDRLRRQPLVWL